MSIHETEKEALEELKKLQQGQEQETTPTENLLQESQQELNLADDEQGEPSGEVENQEEVIEQEQLEGEQEQERQEEEETEEEPKTPAGLRHKLKREKEERKRAESEAQELRERIARLEGMQEASQIAQTTQQTEPQEEIPDPDIDPDGYTQYQIKQLQAKQQEYEDQAARLKAERQWDAMEREYSLSNPDYENAKKYLINQEIQKIKKQYPHATDMQITQHIKEQEYLVVGSAARAGQDPLKYIEFLAFESGYRGENVKAEKKPIEQKPNIAAINRNQRKHDSIIGGSSAGSQDGKPTPEQILNMSFKELEKNRAAVDDYVKKIRIG
jgi:DNA repair exonuclease SbcCD ATPase subunit